MRVVVQRVRQASVSVEGQVIGAIGGGLLVLAGFAPTDTPAVVDWMAAKLGGLRLFPDAEGKLNRSVLESGGGVLVVSQFTLYGDASRGRRPSFVAAAPPELAIPLYQHFLIALGRHQVPVQSGQFGADMQVALINDGPVTLILERDQG